MNIAHDIYAETNPAFCAYVLSSFVAAYRSIGEQSAPLVTAYLALPIALSDDLSDSFNGTNKKTGLNTWADRNPQTVLGLADRVNLTLRITEDAVRFGCFSRIIALEADASLSPGKSMLKKAQIVAMTDESIRRVFRRSEVLGYWFASAGSMRTVLDILGVSL